MLYVYYLQMPKVKRKRDRYSDEEDESAKMTAIVEAVKKALEEKRKKVKKDKDENTESSGDTESSENEEKESEKESEEALSLLDENEEKAEEKEKEQEKNPLPSTSKSSTKTFPINKTVRSNRHQEAYNRRRQVQLRDSEVNEIRRNVNKNFIETLRHLQHERDVYDNNEYFTPCLFYNYGRCNNRFCHFDRNGKPVLHICDNCFLTFNLMSHHQAQTYSCKLRYYLKR